MPGDLFTLRRVGRESACWFWGLCITLPQQIWLSQSPLCTIEETLTQFLLPSLLSPPLPSLPSAPKQKRHQGHKPRSDKILSSAQAPPRLPFTLNIAIPPPAHTQAGTHSHTLTHAHRAPSHALHEDQPMRTSEGCLFWASCSKGGGHHHLCSGRDAQAAEEREHFVVEKGRLQVCTMGCCWHGDLDVSSSY